MFKFIYWAVQWLLRSMFSVPWWKMSYVGLSVFLYLFYARPTDRTMILVLSHVADLTPVDAPMLCNLSENNRLKTDIIYQST